MCIDNFMYNGNYINNFIIKLFLTDTILEL